VAMEPESEEKSEEKDNHQGDLKEIVVEICPKCYKPKDPDLEKQQPQQQQQQQRRRHKQKYRRTEKTAKDGAGKRDKGAGKRGIGTGQKRVVGDQVVIDSEPKSTGANVNKTLTITGADDDDGYYDDDEEGDCHNAGFFKSLSSSDFSDIKKKGVFSSGKGGKSDKAKAVHRRIVCLSVLDILFGCVASVWCCGLIPCGLGIGALYYTYKSHPDHKKAYKLAKTGCGIAVFFMVSSIAILIIFFIYVGSTALDATQTETEMNWDDWKR